MPPAALTPTEDRNFNLVLAASNLCRAGECDRIGFVRSTLLFAAARRLRATGEDALAERATEAARSASADAGIAALHADVLDLIRARVRQHLLVSSQRQLAQIEVAKAEFRALVDAWVTKYPPDDEERDFLGDFLADYFHERETASRAAMERAS